MPAQTVESLRAMSLAEAHLTLRMRPVYPLTDEEFERLCRENPDLRLERTACGDLEIMSPTGSDSGRRNMSLCGQLWAWNRQARRGVAFDSSAGFTLENTAIRGPDAAWIASERWDGVPRHDRERCAPICPDFVAELRSPSDDIRHLRDKMHEYHAQGVRLGWLIDPFERTVEVYRPDRPVEALKQPKSLSGEDVLPGFELDLSEILDG